MQSPTHPSLPIAASSETESLYDIANSASSCPEKIQWRWGVLAAVLMALLALWPQLNLQLKKGTDSHGVFVSNIFDENIYLAYINSLIEQKSRKSDPLIEKRTALRDPESLFSVQFIPPFILALLVQWTGISTANVFALFLPLSALLSALSLFFLIARTTGNSSFAGCGAFFILCFGTMAGRDGAICLLTGTEPWFGFFPFLRRYQPGFAFPLFFLFTFLIWKSFTQKKPAYGIIPVSAGLIFAALVFSYFYLWTAALAWFVCITFIWLLTGNRERKFILQQSLPVMIIAAISLAVYFWLLSDIASTTSRLTVLERIHTPDLLRGPEIIGIFVLLALFAAIKMKITELQNSLLLFTTSLALLPLIVFNQQVITGYSLQPFHYEIFITNYAVLLSFVLTIAIFLSGMTKAISKQTSRKIFPIAFLIILSWGVIETADATLVHENYNLSRHKFLPVAMRLKELQTAHPSPYHNRAVVFSPQIEDIADHVSIYTPLAVLWALHLPVSPSLTPVEQEERFFLYLHYSDVTPEKLQSSLTMGSFFETSALLGFEKVVKGLSREFKPVTPNEIQVKVTRYKKYLDNLTPEKAMNPTLSYVIVSEGSGASLSNLDKWYVRDAGERIAGFSLYQVTPRNLPVKEKYSE